jgi:mono/diheme cytochrome c family protein
VASDLIVDGRSGDCRRLHAALVITLVITQAACDWPWRHDMADQPSRPAAAGPRLPSTGTVPTNGEVPLDAASAERVLRNPLPADAPLDAGRKLYDVYCAPCHGHSGAGDGPVARYFSIAMGNLTSGDVQQHPDGWFYSIITNGTDHMPRSSYELDPFERWQVVHFVRALGGRDR